MLCAADELLLLFALVTWSRSSSRGLCAARAHCSLLSPQRVWRIYRALSAGKNSSKICGRICAFVFNLLHSCGNVSWGVWCVWDFPAAAVVCVCVCVNAARLMCVFLPFKGSGDEDVARACLMCDALQCFSVSRRRAANVTLFLPRCCRVLLVSSVCHHMCVFVLKSPFSCARHGCCVSLSWDSFFFSLLAGITRSCCTCWVSLVLQLVPSTSYVCMVYCRKMPCLCSVFNVPAGACAFWINAFDVSGRVMIT